MPRSPPPSPCRRRCEARSDFSPLQPDRSHRRKSVLCRSASAIFSNEHAMRALERAMLSSAFVRRWYWLIPSMCFDFEGYLVWVFGVRLGGTLATLPVHSISCLSEKLTLLRGT